MRWQEQQVQPFRKLEIGTLVPASLIQDQQQVFVWPNPLFLGKSGKSEGKGHGIDCRHEQLTRLSALWLDKPIEIHPLIARSDHGPHSGSLSSPDAAQNRFETDAVLILAPEFNVGFWIRLMQLLNLLWEFF
jgi:hypothetical protein